MTFLASLLYLEQCLFLPLEHTTCLPFHPSSFLHPLILHPYPFLLSFFFFSPMQMGALAVPFYLFLSIFTRSPFLSNAGIPFLFFFFLSDRKHACDTEYRRADRQSHKQGHPPFPASPLTPSHLPFFFPLILLGIVLSLSCLELPTLTLIAIRNNEQPRQETRRSVFIFFVIEDYFSSLQPNITHRTP